MVAQGHNFCEKIEFAGKVKKNIVSGGLKMYWEADKKKCSPASSPGQGHYIVFLSKTLNSHSGSLHPEV